MAIGSLSHNSARPIGKDDLVSSPGARQWAVVMLGGDMRDGGGGGAVVPTPGHHMMSSPATSKYRTHLYQIIGSTDELG